MFFKVIVIVNVLLINVIRQSYTAHIVFDQEDHDALVKTLSIMQDRCGDPNVEAVGTLKIYQDWLQVLQTTHVNTYLLTTPELNQSLRAILSQVAQDQECKKIYNNAVKATQEKSSITQVARLWRTYQWKAKELVSALEHRKNSRLKYAPENDYRMRSYLLANAHLTESDAPDLLVGPLAARFHLQQQRRILQQSSFTDEERKEILSLTTSILEHIYDLREKI